MLYQEKYETWANDKNGKLAIIILTDQISRIFYRG